MANIMLNDYCNLSCSYCFARNTYSMNKKYITLNNFKLALDFILKDNEELIGLIGGEPTLHPKFYEILELLNCDERVKNILLFTNGTQLQQMITTLECPKASILLNFNNESDIGENYTKIIKNINELYERGYDLEHRLALGLNVYNNRIRFDIFDVLQRFNIRIIRISLVVPNNDLLNNPRNYFLEYSSTLKKYISIAIEKNIIPIFDCNTPPLCTIDNKFRKEILMKMKNRITNVICNECDCFPVIDILPNLDVIRCFGTWNYTKKKISQFKNIEELRDYYISSYDLKVKNTNRSPSCKNCNYRNKCSGGCLGIK